MKTAFLFPGQGSQCFGMGKELYDNFSVAKDVFVAADDYLKFKLSSVCFEGSEEVLKQTQYTQPALAVVSIAYLETLRAETGFNSDFVLGHSLGEYSALYTAKVITLEQTMKLLYKRGNLMSTISDGGMVAVIGASSDKIKEAINKVSDFGYVDIANYNSEMQTVITGDKNALSAIESVFADMGVNKFIPLAVSGAFHSRLIKKIVPEFEEYLSQFTINDATMPVITNVDAKLTINKNELKQKMLKQLYSPVYWYQSVLESVKNGTERFIELGSGKVLTGLNKRIVPDIPTYNISDINKLKEFIELIEKE